MPSDYVATRIERRAATPTNYRVRGLARNVDGIARTLQIGTESYDLGAIGLPPGLRDGSVVRLRVATTRPLQGAWPVLAAVVESRVLSDRDEAEVEGLITSFTDVTRFAVNGVEIRTDPSTRFPDGIAGLLLGARVEVEGRITGGVLVAVEVDLRSDDDEREEGIDLRGAISSLNLEARTFVVRGVTVAYGIPPLPRFEGGSEADLANGRCVRVRGTLSDDRTVEVAKRIEFVDHCLP